MRSRRTPGAIGWLALWIVLAALLTAPRPVAAAPVDVNASSRIGKIRIEFTGTSTFTPTELRGQMTLSELQPSSGFRRALAHLPFVPDVGAARLVPLEVQQNAARLREFYALAGFPDARIDYRVTPTEEVNRFDITFLVYEGLPFMIAGVEFIGADSAGFRPPADVADDFATRRRRAERLAGSRLSRAVTGRLEGRLKGFWADRGYPLATVAVGVRIDSTARLGTLVVRTEVGPLTRVGEIRLEGAESLDEDVIRRELPFHEGDVYSARRLPEGQREIQGLPAVRLVMVDTPGAAATDSVLDVRVRVTEGDRRLLAGEIGYVTSVGIQGELRATHQNFLGDSRSLTASGVVRPGTLSDEEEPEELYRASLTLQQPYVFDRRLSLLIGPFVEFLDDNAGRSRELGGTSTLIYTLSPLRSLALTYHISRRELFEFEAEAVSADQFDRRDASDLNAPDVLDSLDREVDLSRLTFTGTIGTADNPTAPRKGFVFRPSLGVTVPGGLNSYEYTRLDLSFTGFLPVGRRIVVVGRVSGGRVFPFGRSLPQGDESGYFKFLGFRDDAFTAGGVEDNRGWENRLLGPKFPDVEYRVEPDPVTGQDSLVSYATGYVPLGGLQRLTTTAELRLPLPGMDTQWGSFLFLDGGRIWTDDAVFAPPSLGIDQDLYYYAVGGGFDFSTPAGAVRLSIGYKLNPSVLDLADSREVLNRLKSGAPLDDIPQSNSLRWQWHLAIGTNF